VLPLRRTAAGFPLAPTQAEWDALTEDERAEVVAALPGDEVQQRVEEESKRREDVEAENASLRDELARLEKER